MRFDDPPKDEEAPIHPESIVPSIDRTSRSIRIKLLMLFAMLIMVILLMKEAGKPERWEWMGFETPKPAELDNAKSTDQTNSEQMGFEPAPANPSTETAKSPATVVNDTPHKSSRPITISSNPSGFSGQRPSAPIVSFESISLQPDYPTAAVAFWYSEFRRLSPDQQKVLLRLVKAIRLGQAVSEDQQPASQRLCRRIGDRRDDFHQTLFDKIALTSDGSVEKTRLANEMYESQEIWDKLILPAMDSASHGMEFTIGQQQAVLRLQLVLDPLIYEQVQDRTSLGWAGDSAAWIRIWEKIVNGEMPTGPPVTRIELMGQPRVYRGKPVTVEGWVRSARKKTLAPESEIGLSHYYVLWVRPRESKLGPYCIYSMTLPDGFPPISESFSDVNVNVRVNGYSFKIRNFIAADSSVDECPIIIAPGLERLQIAEFTSVSRWQPSRTTLTLAFILIPLIATGLAWLAFRTSKTHHYVPGKKSQMRIDKTLNELAHDPQIQTEREKVMSLYESDPHD